MESIQIGAKFNHLTVIGFDSMRLMANGKHATFMNFRCDCGKEKVLKMSPVKNGIVRSCGCLIAINHQKAMVTHGMSKSKLFGVWNGMNSRCHTPSDSNFSYYGGRGISVCDEWRKDFVAFKNWALNNGYAQGLDLDRKDNGGNYSPDNCRFVPHFINTRNRRNTKSVEYNGITLPLKVWCDFFNLDYRKTLNRLKRGKPIDFCFEYRSTDDLTNYEIFQLEKYGNVLPV